MKLLFSLILFQDSFLLSDLIMMYKRLETDDYTCYQVGSRKLVEDKSGKSKIVYQEGERKEDKTFQFLPCNVVIVTDMRTNEFECYPYNFDYDQVLNYFLDHEEITIEQLLEIK